MVQHQHQIQKLNNLGFIEIKMLASNIKSYKHQIGLAHLLQLPLADQVVPYVIA